MQEQKFPLFSEYKIGGVWGMCVYVFSIHWLYFLSNDLWVSLVSWNWVLFACSQFPFLPLSSKESLLKWLLWTLSRSPQGWYRKQRVSFLYKLLGVPIIAWNLSAFNSLQLDKKLMNCQGIRQNTINISIRKKRACNKKESSTYIAPFIPCCQTLSFLCFQLLYKLAMLWPFSLKFSIIAPCLKLNTFFGEKGEKLHKKNPLKKVQSYFTEIKAK